MKAILLLALTNDQPVPLVVVVAAVLLAAATSAGHAGDDL